MTEHGTALETLLAYHDAWSGGDFDAAMTHVADDVVCDAPAGRFQGADAFQGFMAPFAAMVTRYERLAAFGDDRIAVIVYDTDTRAVDGAPGAEVVTVAAGRIRTMRIIFDRLPFEEARRAAAAQRA
ncbi:nuclear transport factor 2 family protein [Cellulomonas sp. URHE0023]|uniref:nuclear transport factor 2 family protein n=1 Tax=Cellulomonas sp. URHE0023 TaxID=1380354 RepID=UPI00047F4408|nr:nuclear transport factor 2 family protein [Cellulomonas sp. URHE0023]